MQLNRLSEQIKLRDEMISNAKRKLQPNDASDFDDPRVIHVEELVNQTSILPPINNGSFGKHSGALIKQLLDNLTEGT
jgi:hypothetical protein